MLVICPPIVGVIVSVHVIQVKPTYLKLLGFIFLWLGLDVIVLLDCNVLNRVELSRHRILLLNDNFA
jgi:hypothetical protein